MDFLHPAYRSRCARRIRRGPLAKARLRASDGSAEVTYERVERHGTPSYLTVHFGPSSVHDGKVQQWVSESLVKVLGNQRVSPQPESSTLASGESSTPFPQAPCRSPLNSLFSPPRSAPPPFRSRFLGASGSPPVSSSCHSRFPGAPVYTVLHASPATSFCFSLFAWPHPARSRGP